MSFSVRTGCFRIYAVISCLDGCDLPIVCAAPRTVFLPREQRATGTTNDAES